MYYVEDETFLTRIQSVLKFVGEAAGKHPVEFLARSLDDTQQNDKRGKAVNALLKRKFMELPRSRGRIPAITKPAYGHLHTIGYAMFRKHLTALHHVYAAYDKDGSTETLTNSVEPLWRYVTNAVDSEWTLETCEKWFREQLDLQNSAAPTAGTSSGTPSDRHHDHDKPTHRAEVRSEAPPADCATHEDTPGASGNAPLDQRRPCPVREDRADRIILAPSAVAPGRLDDNPLMPPQAQRDERLVSVQPALQAAQHQPPLSQACAVGATTASPFSREELEATATTTTATTIRTTTTTTTTTPNHVLCDRTGQGVDLGADASTFESAKAPAEPIADPAESKYDAGAATSGQSSDVRSQHDASSMSDDAREAGHPVGKSGETNETGEWNGHDDAHGADDMSVCSKSTKVVGAFGASGTDEASVESESNEASVESESNGSEDAGSEPLCCYAIPFDDEAAPEFPSKRRKGSNSPAGREPTFQEIREQVTKILLFKRVKYRLPALVTVPSPPKPEPTNDPEIKGKAKNKSNNKPKNQRTIESNSNSKIKSVNKRKIKPKTRRKNKSENERKNKPVNKSEKKCRDASDEGSTSDSDDEPCSCMQINGGRFELFLGAWHRIRGTVCSARIPNSDCSHVPPPIVFFLPEKDRRSAFKEVMQEFSAVWLDSKGVSANWIADQLIKMMNDYVLEKDQAMKDLVQTHGGVKYVGRVYSLIVSYGKVDAQTIHIDCLYPDYLGAMLLTPGPKTVLFPVHKELGIRAGEMTCKDFAKLVCERMPDQLKNLEEELAEEFAKCKETTQLIEACGYSLASNEVRERAKARLLASNPVLADTQPGYLGMLGSTCHCGPAAYKPRVVLFSTYTQEADKRYTKEGDEVCTEEGDEGYTSKGDEGYTQEGEEVDEGYEGVTQYNVVSFLVDFIIYFAPEASQAAMEMMMRLFTNVLAIDPSLGVCLDGVEEETNNLRKCEALRGLNAIKSLFNPK
jgi:hypothetical protein